MISLVLLGALLFIGVGTFSYVVTLYNGLILVKNNILKAWGNIDVLLKQRHDEIPKLIKTCEAYMKFEQDTLAKVVALRGEAAGAQGVGEKSAKEGALTAGLRQLFALAEKYPDLKAQASFQQFQNRISDLENQIADRREFYNETVNNYNIRIQSFPDSLLAGFMGLAPREMFQVGEADRQDVEVNIRVP